MALPNYPPQMRSSNSSAASADAMDVDVDLSQAPIDIEGMLAIPTADGGLDIDTAPQRASGANGNPKDDFKANLAFFMDEGDLDAIGQNMVERVESDDRSRDEWKETIAEGIDLLGTRVEDLTFPFPEASDAFSPLMPKAVYRNWAKSMAQLLPPTGPVRCQIPGVSTQELEDQASRKSDWMNLYLTALDKSYYPDTTQMLWWWTLVGSTFKKVYQCPLKRRPLSPFIRPENFIAAYSTTNLYTAPRLTHQFFPSPREIALMVQRKLWLGDMDDLTPFGRQDDMVERNAIKRASDEAEGVRKPSEQRTSHFDDVVSPYYETHADLDLSEMMIDNQPAWKILGTPEGVPVPIRLVVSKEDQRTVAVYRNWERTSRVFDRKNCFVHYKLLPGTGFYGFGYAHLLGNLARTGTALRRQIIDNTTLNLFPGGIRDASVKLDDNNKLIGPCEWVPLTTGGVPLRDVFMPMPYKEVSPVTMDLLKYTDASGDDLANTAEIAVGDGREDAPVGTTLALQEAATVIATAMIREGHFAQREEFGLIAQEFGENLPTKPYPFEVAGGQKMIMRADFLNNIAVLPVSDPNITSNAQRVGRAEIKVRMASQFPQNHNMSEVLRDFYAALGDSSEAIARYLPPPGQAEPADPLTENQMVILGQQVTAGLTQNHKAHIESHMPLAQNPAMQAHIGQHMAMEMRVQVERILGVPLPPPGTKLPPQIEDQIALMTAGAMKQLMAEQGQPEPSPGQIAMRDLDIKEMGVKERAHEAELKASVEAFKENLRAYSDQQDRNLRKWVVGVQSAADAADNKVPELDYIKSVLEIGEMIGLPVGKNAGVDAHVKLRAADTAALAAKNQGAARE